MKTLPGVASLVIALGVALTQSPSSLFGQTNSATKPHLPADLEHLLENADEFVLLSLDPTPDFERKSKNTFRKHPILGQTEIKAASERANLIAALNEGISARGVTSSNGVVFAQAPLPDCFNPRHGIRGEKNGETVEFLICFECEQIKINSSNGTDWFFQTSKKPAAIFNRVLKKAGVPLPKN